LTSRPIRWLAYLAGWTLFAVLHQRGYRPSSISRTNRPVARLSRDMADDRIFMGFSQSIRLVAGWPLPSRAQKVVVQRWTPPCVELFLCAG
jgi:hypothetical protein